MIRTSSSSSGSITGLTNTVIEPLDDELRAVNEASRSRTCVSSIATSTSGCATSTATETSTTRSSGPAGPSSTRSTLDGSASSIAPTPARSPPGSSSSASTGTRSSTITEFVDGWVREGAPPLTRLCLLVRARLARRRAGRGRRARSSSTASASPRSTPGSPTPPAGATRLDGLTLPGFANAHSHAFHRALRGRTQRGDGSFWTWREQMYELAGALDPDSYFAPRPRDVRRDGAGRDHRRRRVPLPPPRAGRRRPTTTRTRWARALIAAAREAGIRITLLDACYLHGGIGEPLNDVQRRFADADADAWAERVDALADADRRRAIGAAIHSVRAVDPASAAAVAAWAAERERAAARPRLRAAGRERGVPRGLRRAPRRRCSSDAGALEPSGSPPSTRPTSTDADIAALGGAGCCCCLCPTTERDLADGIGPGARAGRRRAPRSRSAPTRTR